MNKMKEPTPYMAVSEAKKYSRALKLAVYLGLSALMAECGGGGSPTSPTNPGMATLKVYNATTGQEKDIIVEIPGGGSSVPVNAADLANGLGDVVTSEFAVRNMDAGIGSLLTAAGPQANISAGDYKVFVPATALRPNGQSIYDCMPNPRLNGNVRNFVVGVLNKPGVDPNGLPWSVWTDPMGNLNENMKSDTGTRYGSIIFEPNAANPDLTVGFANETNPRIPAPAWAEGFRHAYMLGPKSVFPLDYDRPGVKDGALEEVFEMIFRVDDICGGTGSAPVIGKARRTNDTQWGLNAEAVNLLRRNMTRAP